MSEIPEELRNIDRKKILVVDDEQDLREALFTFLAAQGYEVSSASDGLEAVEMVKKDQPDLMLLDIMMPNMTGKDVLDHLRTEGIAQDMKVLILTALSDLDSLSEILDRGGMDYLVKSDWKLEDIVRKVAEKLTE